MTGCETRQTNSALLDQYRTKPYLSREHIQQPRQLEVEALVEALASHGRSTNKIPLGPTTMLTHFDVNNATGTGDGRRHR